MTPSVKNFVSGALAVILSLAPAAGINSGSAVGTDNGGVKTVYVAVGGDDSSANGTKAHPYGSVDAAREAIRTVNKGAYDEIDVIVGAGQYGIGETIVFTAEDSGTAKCPIRYIGEEGAELCGGVTFTAEDFEPADGKTADCFMTAVKEKAVMIDLGQFGIDASVEEMSRRTPGGDNVFFYANGKAETIARYPNGEFAYVTDGSYINSAGGVEWAELGVDTMFVFFAKEHVNSVRFWSDLSTVYTVARYNTMDYPDGDRMYSYHIRGYMEVPFTRRMIPEAGMPFYWYNIPEELDVPGEYYIDADHVLYYYPTEEFGEAEFSVPVLDADMITLDGCSFVGFENLTLSGTRKSAITGVGRNITIDGCTICEASVDGVRLEGSNIRVNGCDIYSIGETAVDITGGDEMELVRSGDVISNNVISDWAIGYGFDTPAILVRGCGTTVAHNECTDSVSTAIDYGGPYHTVEYNYCDNTCLFSGNNGVIGSTEVFCYGTVVRYNYVGNSGFTRDTAIDDVGTQGILLGGGQSGVTVYGNVVENVTGAGISMFGGRDNEVYGNLTSTCRYGIHYDSCFILQAYNIDPIGCNRVGTSDEHIRSAKWKEKFPVLGTYTYYNYGMDYDAECLGTKNFNAAPVSKIYDNVYYLDKNVHERIDHPFYYDKYVTEYSGSDFEIPAKSNGTLNYITAKNADTAIGQFVADNADKLAITAEQFAEIGREK